MRRTKIYYFLGYFYIEFFKYIIIIFLISFYFFFQLIYYIIWSSIYEREFDSYPLRTIALACLFSALSNMHLCKKLPICCTHLISYIHSVCFLSLCGLFWEIYLKRGFLRFSAIILKSNFREQSGRTILLIKNYFEERRLWGIILENNFGKPLLETTFGGSFSNCSEQLLITTCGNGFGEQLCGTGLENCFGEQE